MIAEQMNHVDDTIRTIDVDDTIIHWHPQVSGCIVYMDCRVRIKMNTYIIYMGGDDTAVPAGCRG